LLRSWSGGVRLVISWNERNGSSYIVCCS
jgi:hypothetical protein